MVDSSLHFDMIPISDKAVANVAKAFKDATIFQHAIPKVILSDSDSWVNVVLQDLCRLYNIWKCSAVVYHPETNALAERLSGKVLDVMCPVNVPYIWDEAWIIFSVQSILI